MLLYDCLLGAIQLEVYGFIGSGEGGGGGWMLAHV